MGDGDHKAGGASTKLQIARRWAKVFYPRQVQYLYRLTAQLLPEFPKISVVVVNRNGGAFLATCLRSIFDQQYPNLEVIAVDGGSTDDSVAILQSFDQHLHHWVSEPDEGQYHAVQKGFARSTGSIMAWINSDDRYLPGAFMTAAKLFGQFPDIEWLMGFPGEFDADGTLVRRIGISWARWSRHRYMTYDFQYVQQESCFWQRSLWERAGGRMDTSQKLAGDLELWARFFRHAPLHTTIASLAGFRHHSPNQRSKAQRPEYLREGRQVIQRELKRLSPIQRLGYLLLRGLGVFTGPLFFFEVPVLRHLHRFLFRLPLLINYDVVHQRYYRGEKLVKLPPLFLQGRSIHREAGAERNLR